MYNTPTLVIQKWGAAVTITLCHQFDKSTATADKANIILLLGTKFSTFVFLVPWFSSSERSCHVNFNTVKYYSGSQNKVPVWFP